MYASETTSDVNARLCNTTTCCLTIVLFKTYLSVLDKYLVGTTIVLFYQGFGHATCGFLNSNIFTLYFGFEPASTLSHTVGIGFWLTSALLYTSLQFYMGQLFASRMNTMH
jgi:hypothetical protein